MPSGKIHSAATAGAIASALTGALVLKVSSPYEGSSLLAFSLGCGLGFLFGPDLDVDGGNISRSYLRSIPGVGPFLSLTWSLFWLPYARVVKHRSWVSHGPFISTAIRILYFGWLPAIGLLTSFSFDEVVLWHLALAFLGLCLSDAFHSWLDLFSKDNAL